MSPTDTPRGPAAETSTGTVSRALQLLGVLADAGTAVTVKHVAETMGLAPSTAHRLLNLLKKEGFVEPGEGSGQYAIGPQFYRVAARVVAAVPHAALAQPVLDALAAQFDETVMFGLYLPRQHAMSFAARANGKHKLQYQIDMHKPLSLLWGASGKAILAYLPDAEVAAIRDAESPSPATGALPPALAQLQDELAEIRARGYATSESQKLPDARGIAAPVFDASGVLGCVILTSPIARMPAAGVEAIGQEIAQQAKALSALFGATS